MYNLDACISWNTEVFVFVHEYSVESVWVLCTYTNQILVNLTHVYLFSRYFL